MKKKLLLCILSVLLITGCKPKTYTVTLYDEGNKLSNITVTKGENIKNIEIPTKEGYIFVTWLKDGLEYNAETPITEDISLTASWVEEPTVIKNYTVTFNFGDYLKTQTVKAGEKVPKPLKDPAKEKHTFLGWYIGDVLYDFDMPVEKNIILLAKYMRNRVVITYDLNGGTGTVETEIDKGEIPEKPNDPTKFGYNFVGWLLDGQPYNFNFPINSDTTIKANWEATTYYKVTFDSDGGNTIPSQMIAADAIITKWPTPEKEGYTFKYWSLGSQEFIKDTKINKNITLKAVYEEIVPKEEPAESITE